MVHVSDKGISIEFLLPLTQYQTFCRLAGAYHVWNVTTPISIHNFDYNLWFTWTATKKPAEWDN